MDMAALLCADAWAAHLASNLRPSAHSLEETSGRCHVTIRGLAPAQSLSDSPESDCGEKPQFGGQGDLRHAHVPEFGGRHFQVCRSRKSKFPVTALATNEFR